MHKDKLHRQGKKRECVLPHFGKMRMDAITREEIERFMEKLVRRGDFPLLIM
jgi:hypothetical protein